MNSKLNTLPKIGLSLFFLLFINACSLPGQETSVENTAQPEATESESDKDNAKVIEKMNYYVDCVNRFSVRIIDSYNSYLKYVDPEVGPTGKESYIGLLSLPFEPAECLSGIEAANAIKVESQLNEPAKAYATALKTIAPLIEETDKYYEQKNYKDDDFAKAKEMHTPLVNAFNEFEKANEALREQMDVVQKELDEYTLKEFEASGDQFGFLQSKLVIEAGKLVNLADVETFDNLNLDEFTTALTSYETVLNELNDYEISHKEEISKISLYSSFNSVTEALLVAAKDLMRAKRDNNVPDQEDQFDLIDELFDVYNKLINASNNIQRRF